MLLKTRVTFTKKERNKKKNNCEKSGGEKTTTGRFFKIRKSQNSFIRHDLKSVAAHKKG